jgi:hypothetical protein
MPFARSTSLAALIASAAFSLFQPTSVAYSAEGSADVDQPAAVAKGVCEFSKFKFVTKDTSQASSSTTFAAVIDSPTSVKIKNEPGCVVVTFSAMAFASAATGELLSVQAVLDGATLAQPGVVQLVAQSNSLADAHTMTFVFPSVDPGNHTIEMQFKSRFNGQSVTLNKWTMTVQF